MIDAKNFDYFSTYLLGAEALNRGIEANQVYDKNISRKQSWLILKYKKHIEVITHQRSSKTSSVAASVCQNKELCKFFLKRAGLSQAKGRAFCKKDKHKLFEYAKDIGFPLVIKPVYGTHGFLVFVGIDSVPKLKFAVSEIWRKKSGVSILVEQCFIGNEYRLFATKDKFVAATKRIPANVIGDGESTIEKLIKIKNSDPRRSFGHKKTLVKISIDDEVKRNLKEMGLTLKTIPKKGKQIFLRKNSNLSTGGDSIDVTDEIHPSVKKIAVQAVRAVPGLAYAGVDFLTTDVYKKQSKNSYIIIELNDSPMFSMHHIPYEGKQRNAAKYIIDMLFPETVKKQNKKIKFKLPIFNIFKNKQSV